MQLCAANRPDGTWIGRQLIRAYCRLHDLGFAHVECGPLVRSSYHAKRAVESATSDSVPAVTA